MIDMDYYFECMETLLNTSFVRYGPLKHFDRDRWGEIPHECSQLITKIQLEEA